jgi:hypothetical protein
LQASISLDLFAVALVAVPGREERSGALAMVELVPLAGILFWLQQVRLKKASSVTRLESKQEQRLRINILLQIEVEIMLARTHSGAGATWFEVHSFCAV